MKVINTRIEINATAEKVWQVLTDFGAYSEWNPFIPEASGKAEMNASLQVKIAPPNGSAMTFTPEILQVRENKEFRWLGALFYRWIFSGEHIFKINALGPDSVEFLHSEKFRGMLVPFLWKNLNSNTRLGFEAMNQALKDRVEGLSD